MKSAGAPYRPGTIRRDVIAGLFALACLVALFAVCGAIETWVA